MAPSDDAQDPAPGPSNVPPLINDYRAQRDAWRAQARGLARMREDVLAANDREARDIVTAARVDVRQILVKARRDLLVLAAQVQAATDTSQESGPGNHAGDADYIVPVQADDLRVARDVFASARHDVRRVLNDARPELDALSSEAGALRSSLQWQPLALNEAPSRVVTPPDLELPATAELPVVSPRDPIAVPHRNKPSNPWPGHWPRSRWSARSTHRLRLSASRGLRSTAAKRAPWAAMVRSSRGVSCSRRQVNRSVLRRCR